MSAFELTYKPFGNSAVLIEWPSKIDPEILSDIRCFSSKIQQQKIKDILEINFVYSSMLIIYNFNSAEYIDVVDKLKNLYKQEVETEDISKTIWEIPVCYDDEFGLDLAFIASEKKKSIHWVIAQHSSSIYTVYGVGFLPGFLYLGGLSKALHIPRKKIPRVSVSKGAVAIGGKQTGIYPKSSPGGWQLLGKTPISLFDVSNNEPCQIQVGDDIKFNPISKEDFIAIESKINQGTYQLKTLSND